MAELVQMFYDPAGVFQKVRDRKIWVAPFVAMIIVSLIVAALVINIIGMEAMTRKQLESNPQLVERMGGQAKVEEAAQQANTPARKMFGYAAAGMGAAVFMLLVAALMLALMNMMDAKLNFGQALGTTSYAFFPFGIVTCVMSALILMLAHDPAELDARNLIHLNAGAFMDSASKPLQSLANSMDLITLGQIVMLSYGFSKVGGVAFGKTLAIVAGLWIVWVLLKMGFAMVF